jgi:hypothetical protein
MSNLLALDEFAEVSILSHQVALENVDKKVISHFTLSIEVNDLSFDIEIQLGYVGVQQTHLGIELGQRSLVNAEEQGGSGVKMILHDDNLKEECTSKWSAIIADVISSRLP